MLDELIQEMPSLPLSYFEERIPSPPDLEKPRCAYLLLSDGYRQAAAETRRRGWWVEEIAGAQHLHMVANPAAVAAALIRLGESETGASDRPGR